MRLKVRLLLIIVCGLTFPVFSLVLPIEVRLPLLFIFGVLLALFYIDTVSILPDPLFTLLHPIPLDDKDQRCSVCGQSFTWVDQHIYGRVWWAGQGKELAHKRCYQAKTQ